MNPALPLADWLIILLYGGIVIAIGLRVGRGHQDSHQLALGGRRLPTWAVLCSMVATEISAATFIGVPHRAYLGNWSYLQFAFGALFAKAVLAMTLIPLYHRLGVVTVYGFLEERFGPRARRWAAIFFIVGRILASGVRLFIAALAFSVATGLSLELCILSCGIVAGVYTLYGGIRAVIWTDTLQGALFLLAAVSTIVAIIARSEGGLGALMGWAEAHDRMRIFTFEPFLSLTSDRPFSVAFIGGFFLTLATHGTDHDMVQRLLTTSDGRKAGSALLGSALVTFPVVGAFLFIGTGLAYFYAFGAGHDISDSSKVFPIFVIHELPVGLRGLIFAGLFAAAMSSLDSAMCAITTTWIHDVRSVSGAPSHDSARTLKRTRVATVVIGSLLILAALLCSVYYQARAEGGGGGNQFSLVDLALSSMTIIYGGLLGIFLLGFISRKRGSEKSVIAGLVAGSLVGLFLFLHPMIFAEEYTLAWSWWIVISASVSFGVASIPRRRAALRGSAP